MTYLELCKRAHLHLGVGPGAPGAAPTTVVGQEGTLLEITTYIAQAWLDIQGMRGDWLWMRSTGTLNTVAGTQDYSLSVQSASQSPSSITRSSSVATVTLTNHGFQIGQSVVISGASQAEYNGTVTITAKTANTFTYNVSGSPATPATGTLVASTVALLADSISAFKSGSCGEYLLCHDGAIGGSDQRPVYFVEQDRFDGYYNKSVVNSGRPLFYTQKKPGQITLYPNPDKPYVLTIPHKTMPTELTADGSTPNMPSKFHMLIVYQAMEYFGGTSESLRVRGVAQQMKQAMLSELVREQTPRLLTSWR